MIEVYEDKHSFSDRYMVIVDNPDKEKRGQKPFYDISISPTGQVAHGSQWTQREVTALRERAAAKLKGASYAFKRVKVETLPPPALRAILTEIETDWTN